MYEGQRTLTYIGPQPTDNLSTGTGQIVNDQSISVRYFWISSWTHIASHLVVGATLSKKPTGSVVSNRIWMKLWQDCSSSSPNTHRSTELDLLQLSTVHCKRTQYDRLSEQQLRLLVITFCQKINAISEDLMAILGLRQKYRQRAQFVELFEMYHGWWIRFLWTM